MQLLAIVTHMPAMKRNRVVFPRITRHRTGNRVVFLPMVSSYLSYWHFSITPTHAHPTSLEVPALRTCGVGVAGIVRALWAWSRQQ